MKVTSELKARITREFEEKLSKIREEINKKYTELFNEKAKEIYEAVLPIVNNNEPLKGLIEGIARDSFAFEKTGQSALEFCTSKYVHKIYPEISAAWNNEISIAKKNKERDIENLIIAISYTTDMDDIRNAFFKAGLTF